MYHRRTKEDWDSDWGLLEVESVLLMVFEEPSMVTDTMTYQIQAIGVKSDWLMNSYCDWKT